MKEILNFVQTYWREILEVVTLLASFLIFLCKKVKVENPSIISFIDEYLPDAIIAAESCLGPSKGSLKKKTVIDTMMEELKLKFHGIKEEKYKKYIERQIELILSTPQKKGASI